MKKNLLIILFLLPCVLLAQKATTYDSAQDKKTSVKDSVLQVQVTNLTAQFKQLYTSIDTLNARQKAALSLANQKDSLQQIFIVALQNQLKALSDSVARKDTVLFDKTQFTIANRTVSVNNYTAIANAANTSSKAASDAAALLLRIAALELINTNVKKQFP